MIEVLEELIKENYFDKVSGTAIIDNISSIPIEISNRSMRFDAMNESNLGRVILWESGDINLEILSIESMDTVYSGNYIITNKDELIDRINKFFRKMN